MGTWKIMVVLVFLILGNKPKIEVKPVVLDQLKAASSARLSGYLGHRLDSSYENRILAQDPDRLIAPFRNRTETSCWQSEFWGKWFTSAVLAYRYRPEARLTTILDKAVEGLLATQSPDGYIGNYAPDRHLQSWDIWGRKYCMLGLLAYYDLTTDKKALDATGRLANHLMLELKQKQSSMVRLGNHRGMAATSILEPICLLYARTGEKQYLDFAKEIVNQWESPDGPQLISKAGVDVASRFPKPQKNWYGWEQGQKAYEMMSCYEGLLELYRLTGEEKYLRAVELTWENIKETEINIAGSGSSVECWFHGRDHQAEPVYHYQETCVTATWIRLSQQLLRLTGQVKYADAIEEAYYNALLGALRPDGSDWAKYTPLSGQRLEGSEQCGMGLNCCNASGPRALYTLPLTAVMEDKSGLQVNFFAEGSYSLNTPDGNRINLRQETNYPASGFIKLSMELEKPEELSVKIRIPGWSSRMNIKVNEEDLQEGKAGSLFEISRMWRKGDVIHIEIQLRGRIQNSGVDHRYQAITWGPLVLARDDRLQGPSLESILTPVGDSEGYIHLEAERPSHPEIWMQFKASFIPESYAEGGPEPIVVPLCDYASAGNSGEAYPFFKTWLPQLYDPRK